MRLDTGLEHQPLTRRVYLIEKLAGAQAYSRLFEWNKITARIGRRQSLIAIDLRHFVGFACAVGIRNRDGMPHLELSEPRSRQRIMRKQAGGIVCFGEREFRHHIWF